MRAGRSPGLPIVSGLAVAVFAVTIPVGLIVSAVFLSGGSNQWAAVLPWAVLVPAGHLVVRLLRARRWRTAALVLVAPILFFASAFLEYLRTPL